MLSAYLGLVGKFFSRATLSTSHCSSPVAFLVVFEFSTCFPADDFFVDVSMCRDLHRALPNERPLESKALPPVHFLEEAVHEVIRRVTLWHGQVAQQTLGTGDTYHVCMGTARPVVLP